MPSHTRAPPKGTWAIRRAGSIASSQRSRDVLSWGCASPSDPLQPAALFEAHHAALQRFIARFTGDPDLAEDVIQETFIRMLEQPPATHPQIRAWLFTVAANIAIDHLKLANRRRTLLALRPGRVPHADPAPDPAEETERNETRARVRRALAALSEKERLVLLMREEGFKHREIAEAAGTTTAAIGTMIARALTKLAAQLGLEVQ